MKGVLKQIRPAIMLTILFTILCGFIYPGIVTGLAQVIFPQQANGSLVTQNGQVIGSELIGQYWTSPRYFRGRPSATLTNDGSNVQPYNAENSSASNLGPTSAALMKRVSTYTQQVQKMNPGTAVPVDLVTASGSGLDPDISVAGALFQVPSVARARGMSESQVQQLVESHITGRFLGVLGESYVNVLDLNMALDAAQKTAQK